MALPFAGVESCGAAVSVRSLLRSLKPISDCHGYRFYDCMKSAAEVWASRHPNPENKDRKFDVYAEYPYNIGLESGVESGFTTDAEESNANTPQRRNSTEVTVTVKLDSLVL